MMIIKILAYATLFLIEPLVLLAWPKNIPLINMEHVDPLE
jgi:hypothetical protein